MQRRLLTITLFSFILLAACKNDQGSHLPQKKMQEVLMDINLAEAYSSSCIDNNHSGGIKNKDSLLLYYKEIFAHHHITQEQFKNSLAWYKNHTDELDTICTAISAQMDKALDEENKKAKKPNN